MATSLLAEPRPSDMTSRSVPTSRPCALPTSAMTIGVSADRGSGETTWAGDTTPRSAADATAEGNWPDPRRQAAALRISTRVPPLVQYAERRIADAEALLEEGDAPPSPEARTACRHHFSLVAGVWPSTPPMPLPFCGSSGAGEVFCEWRRGSRRVFLTFHPNGFLSLFYARVRGVGVVAADTVPRPSHLETAGFIRWVLGGAE